MSRRRIPVWQALGVPLAITGLIAAAILAYYARVGELQPAAIVVSGDQLLTEYRIDGDWVTEGYWFINVAVDYPPGDIIMRDIQMEIAEGEVARTQRDLRLEFESHTPWYRWNVERTVWRFALARERFLHVLGVGKDYLWVKAYNFPFYRVSATTVGDWVAPYTVNLYVNDTLKDSKNIAVGGATWTEDKFVLEGDPGEKLEVYHLGQLNRGKLDPPGEEYAFIWDPAEDEWRLVRYTDLAYQFGQATIWHKSDDAWWPDPGHVDPAKEGPDTYEEAWNYFKIWKVAPIAGEDALKEQMDPDALAQWSLGNVPALFSDVNPAEVLDSTQFMKEFKKEGWKFVTFWGVELTEEEKMEWHGGIFPEVAYACDLYMASSSNARNVMLEILADATLFDTIIWRQAAGVPEIISITNVTGTSDKYEKVVVTVKNVGITPDRFRLSVEFGDDRLRFTDLATEVYIPAGEIRELTFWESAVLDEGEHLRCTNTVTVWNLGTPRSEDQATYTSDWTGVPGAPPTEPPPEEPGLEEIVRRIPWLWIAVGVIALLLVMVVALMAMRRRPVAPRAPAPAPGFMLDQRGLLGILILPLVLILLLIIPLVVFAMMGPETILLVLAGLLVLFIAGGFFLGKVAEARAPAPAMAPAAGVALAGTGTMLIFAGSIYPMSTGEPLLELPPLGWLMLGGMLVIAGVLIACLSLPVRRRR